jgi:hypothetical protein
MNTTYDLPKNLGDLMGAYDSAHWETEVLELKPDAGVLKRGSVLSLVTGKLGLATSTNQSTAYGVLLDPQIDTAAKFTDGSVTGSVARAGSFRGAALLAKTGTDVAALKDKLRDVGVYVEGAIVANA